jgi:hypothetical protein
MNKQALITQYKREAAQGKAAAHMTFKQWYSAKVDAVVATWMKAA